MDTTPENKDWRTWSDQDLLTKFAVLVENSSTGWNATDILTKHPDRTAITQKINDIIYKQRTGSTPSSSSAAGGGGGSASNTNTQTLAQLVANSSLNTSQINPQANLQPLDPATLPPKVYDALNNSFTTSATPQSQGLDEDAIRLLRKRELIARLVTVSNQIFSLSNEMKDTDQYNLLYDELTKIEVEIKDTIAYNSRKTPPVNGFIILDEINSLKEIRDDNIADLIRMAKAKKEGQIIQITNSIEKMNQWLAIDIREQAISRGITSDQVDDIFRQAQYNINRGMDAAVNENQLRERAKLQEEARNILIQRFKAQLRTVGQVATLAATQAPVVMTLKLVSNLVNAGASVAQVAQILDNGIRGATSTALVVISEQFCPVLGIDPRLQCVFVAARTATTRDIWWYIPTWLIKIPFDILVRMAQWTYGIYSGLFILAPAYVTVGAFAVSAMGIVVFIRANPSLVDRWSIFMKKMKGLFTAENLVLAVQNAADKTWSWVEVTRNNLLVTSISSNFTQLCNAAGYIFGSNYSVTSSESGYSSTGVTIRSDRSDQTRGTLATILSKGSKISTASATKAITSEQKGLLNGVSSVVQLPPSQAANVMEDFANLSAVAVVGEADKTLAQNMINKVTEDQQKTAIDNADEKLTDTLNSSNKEQILELVKVFEGNVYQALPTGEKGGIPDAVDMGGSQETVSSDVTMSPFASRNVTPFASRNVTPFASPAPTPNVLSQFPGQTIQGASASAPASASLEQQQSVIESQLDKIASKIDTNSTEAVTGTITLNGQEFNVKMTPLVNVDDASVKSNNTAVTGTVSILQSGRAAGPEQVDQAVVVELDPLIKKRNPTLFARAQTAINKWFTRQVIGGLDSDDEERDGLLSHYDDDDDHAFGGRSKSRRRRTRSTKKRPIRRRRNTKRRGTRKRQRRYTKKRRGLRRR